MIGTLVGTVLFWHKTTGRTAYPRNKSFCITEITIVWGDYVTERAAVPVSLYTSGRQPFGPHGPLNSQLCIPRTTNMNFFLKRYKHL
jgi:hypothetical protein